MNKNLIIGVLAVAAVWYFVKSQNKPTGLLDTFYPGNAPIKPEKKVSGLKLDNVHNVI